MTSIAKQMLNELITIYGHSTAVIAEKLGVTKRTIDHMLSKEKRLTVRNEAKLLGFYWACVLNIKSAH